MRKTAPISPQVVKALEAVGMSADEFLRQALNVQAEGFTTEGVTFPEGTAFMAWYKDRPYWGHVKNGALEVMNGWDFWQCKFPGKSDFVRISTLRPAKSRSRTH